MFGIFNPKVAEISVDKVKKALDAKEKVILLDVRTLGEVSRGKIAGSINIPLQEISSDVEKVIPDKKEKIYVYCLSGSRSAIATEEMVKLGYSNVFSVTNGILAWRASHYPTTS